MHSAPLKKHIFFGCREAGKLADEKSRKLEESTYAVWMQRKRAHGGDLI